MNILLVDIHHDGHHLEYASKLREELLELHPDSNIDFLTLCAKDVHDQYFQADELTYLYQSDVSNRLKANSVSANIHRGLTNPRDEFISQVTNHTKGYDIIHFLHIDDIIKEIVRHGNKIEGKVLASLNGGFFRTQEMYRTKIASSIIKTGTDSLMSKAIPDILSRQAPWNLINMSRAMRSGVIEELLVNSELGCELLGSLQGVSKSKLTVIPDPVEPWFRSAKSQGELRNELGIPPNEFLFMFFGEMRHEKGVDILLDALNKYKGQNIGCIIAGKPLDLNERDLQTIDNESVSIYPRLGYIPQDEVRLYYEAPDCIVYPYRRSFGEYRRSGTFQKACSVGRPVIASQFGWFEKVVSDWDLGLTFNPEDASDLANALETAVEKKNEIYDPNKMQNYAQRNTYEKLARITSSKYRELTVTI